MTAAEQPLYAISRSKNQKACIGKATVDLFVQLTLLCKIGVFLFGSYISGIHMKKLMLIMESKPTLAAMFGLITVMFAYTVINHQVFGEWDGVMHYFSGKHLIENGVYIGWASHFWPPLQPLLLTLGDPFQTGKIVSVVSGVITLISIYFISDFYLKNPKKSIMVVLYVFSTTIFVETFTLVENHALETAFFMLGYLIFLHAREKNSVYFFVWCGGVVALAGLSRYTSYALALSLAMAIFFEKRSLNSFKNTFYFSMCFILISSLWWVPNYFLNGSPLHTWQYLNIGKEVFPAESNQFLWWHQKDIHSLTALILSFPSEFLSNFKKNIFQGLFLIGSHLNSFEITSFIGLALFSVFVAKNKIFKEFVCLNWPVFLVSVIFLLITSLAFNFTLALAPIIILVTTSIVVFTLNKSSRTFSVVVLFALINIAGSFVYMNTFLAKEKTDGAQLTDLNEINDILLKEAKSKAVLASVNPARAYYSGIHWVMSPLGGKVSLCDFIDYNLPSKVVNYAPKVPVDSSDLKIDYLTLTSGMHKKHDFINEDLTLNTKSCHQYDFEILFSSSDTVLYKVTR